MTITQISADKLRRYIDQTHEKDYALIDVRQPQEYQLDHIPGARSVPLPQIETRLAELPTDRDIVFYCRTGGRSQAAAAFYTDAVNRHKTVFNLSGGILAWEGEILTDMPRVHIFDTADTHAQRLHLGMDMEKGAWRFYSYLAAQLAGTAVGKVFTTLSKAETAHARIIYQYWLSTQAAPPSFDQVFDSLDGAFLEGGLSLDEMYRQVQTEGGQSAHLALLEMALEIEFAAYDLYRSIADGTDDADTAQSFLSIAQAEKKHMAMLADAIERLEQAPSGAAAMP
jgi:rhodanese-related sulfurtransferase/rubrerythrin